MEETDRFPMPTVACLRSVFRSLFVFSLTWTCCSTEVWEAAGTWNDNFGANPNDIVRVAGGVVTDLKRA